jgi:hypothetical protein
MDGKKEEESKEEDVSGVDEYTDSAVSTYAGKKKQVIPSSKSFKEDKADIESVNLSKDEDENGHSSGVVSAEEDDMINNDNDVSNYIEIFKSKSIKPSSFLPPPQELLPKNVYTPDEPI